MPRSPLLAFSLLAVGAAATWLGTQGAGPVPPLGALLSPGIGLWINAQNDLPATASAPIPGLADSVSIRYDSRSVPHIFATSDLDAVRALGYVVARDRLFQLELQARAGEGTLTELVGSVALPADQETRHLGMPRAAEQRIKQMDPAGKLAQLLQAYADGINAYGQSLGTAQLPVEYKLLQKTPRVWLPIHSMHLLNRMGYTLAHAPVELDLVAARATIGESAARAIFDSDSPVQEPIQPAARSAPREALAALPAPSAPDTSAARFLASLTNGPVTGPLRWTRDRVGTPEERAALQQERAFASNNWAVSPSRSATGKALLAGDPHLELTLPSIWYEVHLVVPGVMDVGGVTIPGLPGVTIGYTRAFAWSFTNTGADVMDFWRETVDNATTPTRYELDGQQQPFVDTRIEQYRDKAGVVIATDTVYYTHRGPMHKQGREWLSMRWTVLEAGDELLGFYGGLQATSATAFLDSIAKYYAAPAQNMIAGDTSGTIAIRSTGKFPIRADSGRGTDIRDGRSRRNDWIGFRTIAQYPQSVRPAQGFLASANQQPIDPADDPLYLGVDGHYEIWRALQINRLLRADSGMTADKMRQFQTSPGSVRAERLVPAFVSAGTARLAQGDASASLKAAVAMLSAWDKRYVKENTGARLFETAVARAVAQLYDELIPAGKEARVATPSESRLLQLVTDSANGWWDDTRTATVREDRDLVLAAALTWAYDSLTKEFGDPAATPWTWGRTTPARPTHLLKLDGFAAPVTPIDGGRGTLNPSVASRRANFGSSWRMVVEFASQPIIHATYPGGQSGNPASPRYLDRFALWAAGTLDSVRTPRTAAELGAGDVKASLSLTKPTPK
jgi:penicillin G amidase